jgi:hypothetical protein
VTLGLNILVVAGILLIGYVAWEGTLCFPKIAWWLRHYATNRKVAGSIPDEVNFKIYLILPAALVPAVYSASNRNEYQKHKNNNVYGE